MHGEIESSQIVGGALDLASTFWCFANCTSGIFFIVVNIGGDPIQMV